MPRAIPPRTMSDIARQRAPLLGRRSGPARIPPPPPAPARSAADRLPRVAPLNQPREWRYQTRPIFKRVRGPLVDVFSEAEEVLIVVDLGGFKRGEISVSMTPEHYLLQGRRGEQHFSEVIELPPNVDVARSYERLLNGVLEIVLPRKEEGTPPTTARRRRKHER